MGKGHDGNFKDVVIQIKRKTSAQWLFQNPILAQGEPGYELDLKGLKFGDGVNPWSSLPYFGGGGGGTGTVTSINATISGALAVTGGPVTTSGTLAFAWQGTSSQYILGNGSLATIISNNNQLTNGAGYITSAALTGYIPYTGANQTINFNSQQLIVNGGGNSTLNVAIGLDALITNSTGVANVALGSGALKFATGSSNMALGYIALGSLTSGGNNVAIGDGSGFSMTSATGNVSIGKAALASSNITGSENVAIGLRSMEMGGNSSFNTAIGAYSLYAQNVGSSNTAMGNASLSQNSTGSFSSALGIFSGGNNTIGSGNVFLGAYSGLYSTTDSNVFYLNNQDRVNTAGDKTGSLLYGIFDANPLNQVLTLNGKIKIVDGTQSNGYVLTTNGVGLGSWQPVAVFSRSINTISTNTAAGSVANTDYYYECTANLTVTLPTAVGNTNEYTFKNNGGTPTVNTTSSQTIDGGLTAVVSTLYASITVYSNNSNWLIK